MTEREQRELPITYIHGVPTNLTGESPFVAIKRLGNKERQPVEKVLEIVNQIESEQQHAESGTINAGQEIILGQQHTNDPVIK